MDTAKLQEVERELAGATSTDEIVALRARRDALRSRLDEGIWNKLLHPRGRGGRFMEVLGRADKGVGLFAGPGMSHREAREVGDLHAAGLLSRRFDTGAETFVYKLTPAGREALRTKKLPKVPKSGRSKWAGVAAEKVDPGVAAEKAQYAGVGGHEVDYRRGRKRKLKEADMDDQTRLEAVEAELVEATDPAEVVRLRARRDVLRTRLGEAVLTAQARKKLPASAFALSGGRYPIHDEAHARNALARVSQHGTPEEQKKVRAAVKRRYPNIDVSK
jgi:hypothetical protein